MRKFLFYALLLLAMMPAMAADVDVTQARAAATLFLQDFAPSMRRGAPAMVADVKLVHTEVNPSRSSQAVYYIFNSDQGFVIVAGDDRARQILAWGDRPLDIATMPENMKNWLDTYKRQMVFLQERPDLEVDAPRITSRSTTPTILPMLTAMWDQAEPYWNHCPKVNGEYCVTGCAATSLSMVFHYWKFPVEPTPPVPAFNYTVSLPELPSITFDWENMLDEYVEGNYNEAQADAVAWLMRYIGQEEHMDYSVDGSGAKGEDILRTIKFFGYDEEAKLLTKSLADNYGNEMQQIYSDEEWAAMLQNELFEGRPVVYCAFDYNSQRGWSGHAFDVDGYNADTDTYHVNWGWSGRGNGDFALNAFSYRDYTFNIEQQMIVGVHPPITTPTIIVAPRHIDMEAFVDQNSTATFVVNGKFLTDDVVMTVDDADGVFSLDATSIALNDLDSGKVVTVTYAPLASGSNTATITLSSPEAEDVTITLNGTATLDVYTPVMLPADSARIGMTEFLAEWTDETASKYVNSYTLEVNTRPGFTLIGEADWSGIEEESSNYANYPEELLPEGWSFSGTGLWCEQGGISINNKSSLITPMYDLSGYEKVTVVVRAKSTMSQSSSKFIVSTSVGQQEFSAPGGAPFTDYVAVLDCSELDQVTIAGKSSFPAFQSISVYAGENDQLLMSAVTEEGGTDYRLITGITDKNYAVTGLAAGGSFYYRVKAHYIDGTISPWSKSRYVVLSGSGHDYQIGDVNHDGALNIQDVSDLISYLLSGDEICATCADVNDDTHISIDDVVDLISILLNLH
jgi:hypothetical protein